MWTPLSLLNFGMGTEKNTFGKTRKQKGKFFPWSWKTSLSIFQSWCPIAELLSTICPLLPVLKLQYLFILLEIKVIKTWTNTPNAKTLKIKNLCISRWRSWPAHAASCFRLGEQQRWLVHCAAVASSPKCSCAQIQIQVQIKYKEKTGLWSQIKSEFL